MITPYAQILQGDALTVLQSLPSHLADCVMTSPPFWGLRDYETEDVVWDGRSDCVHQWVVTHRRLHNGRGDAQKRALYRDQKQVPDKFISHATCTRCGAWKGSLGLEPTPDLYIKHLCDGLDETKRILKPTGTLWVNIDDTYHKKSLVGIPERFIVEMLKRGWIYRNRLVWWKSNCAPESVKDRFTVDYEFVYLFTKSKKYYFKQQLELLAESSGKRARARNVNSIHVEKMGDRLCPKQGRNKGCVWTIATARFKGDHFATYPEDLCEIPIDAGCPQWVCNRCGKPRQPVYRRTGEYVSFGGYGSKTARHIGVSATSSLLTKKVAKREFAGLSDCGCNADFSPGIVMDPFCGTGTTGLVALRQGKNFIGNDLKPEYVRMAEESLGIPDGQRMNP